MNFLNILRNSTFKYFNPNILKIKNKINLDKRNNFKNFYVIYSSRLIISNDDRDIEILSTKIKLFLRTMQNNCKNFNSKIFIKNFKRTLFNIENIKGKLMDGTNGIVKFDKIVSFKLLTFDVVYHELLHLSSQEDEGKKHFPPFDEGYTQLLAERYFNENIGKVYLFEVIIMKNIESILGKDSLEKRYFNGNFYKIIFDLYKYETKRNIKKFIANLSEIFIIEKEDCYDANKKHLQNLLNEVFDFLFSCLKKKIQNTSSITERKDIIDSGIWCDQISIYGDNDIYRVNLLDEQVFNEFVTESLKVKTKTKSYKIK